MYFSWLFLENGMKQTHDLIHDHKMLLWSVSQTHFQETYS